MHWAQPQFLLLLVPIAAASFTVLKRIARNEAFGRFASPSLLPRLAPLASSQAKIRKGILHSLAVAFLVIALARPQWGVERLITQTPGLDLLVLVDVSRSMAVEDVRPSRLRRAQQRLRELLSSLPGDRVGIVAFAAQPFLASPLTPYREHVATVMDALSPEGLAAQGTDLGLALEMSIDALTHASESRDSKALLLVTDGEDFEERLSSAEKRLQQSGIRVITWWVGTEAGGNIPLKDPESGRTIDFKRDTRGQLVVSHAVRTGVESLTRSVSGSFFELNDRSPDVLTPTLNALNRLPRSPEKANESRTVYHERFGVFLAAALFCLALEMALRLRARAHAPQGLEESP